MRRVEVELPLPPRALSPNASNQKRGPHSAKSIAVGCYKELVSLMVRAGVRRGGWWAPGVGVVWVVGGLKRGGFRLDPDMYLPRDADNAVASFKAGFDGMVAGGALLADTWGHMVLGRIESTPLLGPWVRVSVEAVE